MPQMAPMSWVITTLLPFLTISACMTMINFNKMFTTLTPTTKYNLINPIIWKW